MMINLDLLSKKFGKKVKIERIKQDISQEELAEASGLHRTTLGAIENGKNSPTLDSMARIANALNLTLMEIVELNNL
jgi:transcriptional regulator with XRE-family HTH domain